MTLDDGRKEIAMKRTLQRLAQILVGPKAEPLPPPTQFFVYHCQLCDCNYEVSCRSQSVCNADVYRRLSGQLGHADLQHNCGEIEGYNGFAVGLAKLIGYREYRNA